MIKSGSGFGLGGKTIKPGGVAFGVDVENLERHGPVKPHITGEKHFSHPARAEFGDYFIFVEADSRLDHDTQVNSIRI